MKNLTFRGLAVLVVGLALLGTIIGLALSGGGTSHAVQTQKQIPALMMPKWTDQDMICIGDQPCEVLNKDGNPTGVCLNPRGGPMACQMG